MDVDIEGPLEWSERLSGPKMLPCPLSETFTFGSTEYGQQMCLNPPPIPSMLTY